MAGAEPEIGSRRVHFERLLLAYSVRAKIPKSQRYPFPFSSFYPDRGNFLGSVGNLASRSLVHKTIAAFRGQAKFPSEGVAAPAWVPGVDWSDQMWFWREGYVALMITDTAQFRYPHYHTRQDTLDYVRLARVVRALERTIRVLDGTIEE